MLKQRGVTLVELMVAIAIGLVISAAMGTIFVTTTKSKQEINRMAEQIENGRIAMDWISQDLRLAGYWGSLEFAMLDDPAAIPDICANDFATLKSAVPLYVQGINEWNSGTVLTCLSDIKEKTDIVIVRRASTCAVGGTGCEAVMTSDPYFQASQCYPPAQKQDGSTGTVGSGVELASLTKTDWYAVHDTDTSLQLHKRDCGNASVAGAPNYAERRRYVARIYFVANNDVAGDGIPTLKMAELRGAGWTTTTIAAGIEQLQLEYGRDTGTDAVPDDYWPLPASVGDWRQVMTVKINLMSRNTTASPEYTNTKTYVLGEKAAGTPNSYGPYNDNIRRHSYSGLVKLVNPAGLRGG